MKNIINYSQKNKYIMIAIKIISEVGMSPSPDHYSGRGAMISDLNGVLLIRIYSKIKSGVGVQAAESFKRMVFSMKKLSATAFLNSLYRLEMNDWKFNEDNVTESSLHYDSYGSSLSTTGSLLIGLNKIDQTFIIRSEFKNLLDKIQKSIR